MTYPVNIDLRNAEDEFRFLREGVLRAHFEVEWDWWQKLLLPQEAPQALYGIAKDGLQIWRTIDGWYGTRHAELAQLVQSIIHGSCLNTLRTAEYLSRTGAPVGRQYQQNPLRGALCVTKVGPSGDFVTLPVALLFVALQGSRANRVTNAWIDSICGAAHNHDNGNWSDFLGHCSPPPSSGSWQESVTWAKNFAPPGKDLRPFASKYCDALHGLGKLLANSTSLAPKPQQTILTRQGPEEDEFVDATDPPELASRDTETTIFANHGSSRDADDPEITQVIEALPTPNDEPDRHEEAQQAETIRGAFRSAIDNQHLQYHWDSLLPTEIAALVLAIERDLLSDREEFAIPAMACATSLCLGMRPHEFWTLPLRGLGTGLDVGRGSFFKAVPRPPQSWQPDPTRPIRLHPSIESIEFPLPGNLAQALKMHLRQNTGATRVDQALGMGAGQRSLWLKEWLTTARNGCHRLTSRRISRVMEIETYAQTQRALMAYWIGGASESPPPSNAYYTAAPANEIQKRYLHVINALWQSAGCNAMLPKHIPLHQGFVGSRLIPFDEDIRSLVFHLKSNIPSTATLQSWESIREFHNRYTAWVVAFLFFATGHRPVDDPFDDHASLSSRLSYALVGDKVFGQPEDRRLVPLCPSACLQFENYLEHLSGLFSLTPKVCEPFRTALESQLVNRTARILPLFFLLDQTGNWYSVSPSTLIQYFPPQWSLPSNVHRHLLATWLFDKDIAEDASTQMMGHDDVGTSALTDLSPHSPSELFAPLRTAVDAFLGHYGWRPQAGLPAATPHGAPDPWTSPITADRQFGTARRAGEREEQDKLDREQVENLISRRLGSRAKKDLKQEDIRALIEDVESLNSNQSTRRALLRQLALRDQLIKIRKDHPLSLKIPPLRRVVNRGAAQFVTGSLTDAELGLELRARFLEHLQELKGAPLCPKRNPTLRAAYALFALIAFGRVLDTKVLNRLITGAPFHIVAGDSESFFIELQCSDRNIRRYPVENLVTALMTSTHFDKAGKNETLRALNRLVATLTGRDRRGNYFELTRLTTIFSHLSRLEVSGSDHAFLTGDSGAVSLPRHDWLRVLTDQAPLQEHLPPSTPEKGKSPELAQPATFDLAGKLQPFTANAARRQALAFVDAVDQELKVTWPNLEIDPNKTKKTKGRNTAPVAALAPKIEALISGYRAKGGLPTISQMLGEWLIKMCINGSRKGQLMASSIETYWRTLKRPLSELAHEYTLNDLMGCGLEEVYGQVLEQTTVDQPHIVLWRLIEFHRFVQGKYGASDVDWSEIIPETFPDHKITVDAGFVTRTEYEIALGLLTNDPDTPDRRERIFNGAALIMLYRFGARAGEIIGLRQVDLMGDIDGLILRICNDDFRRVKTDAGIRNVPILSQLSQSEQQVLHVWREHMIHCHPDDRLAGLFANRSHGRLLIDTRRMMSRIGQALIAATGNPDARPHYCRHTLASLLLYQNRSQHLATSVSAHANPLQADKITDLLRGSTTCSRRLPWQASALIGHAHPRTTARYYGHLNDLRLADSPNVMLDPALDDQSLAIALGVEAASIARCRDNLGPYSTTKAIMVSLARIPKASNLVGPRPPTKLPPRPASRHDGMSRLEMTARILQAADRDTRLENIANRLLLEINPVLEVLNRADSICEATNFMKTDKEATFRIPNPNELSRNAWEHIFSAAEKLNKAFRPASDTLQKASTIWEHGYFQRGNHFLISNVDDIKTMAQVFAALDIPTAGWHVDVDEQSLTQNWCIELLNELRKLRFVFSSTSGLPKPAWWGRSTEIQSKRIALVVREANSGLIRSHKAAHFLWMIVACATGPGPTGKPH